MRKSLISAGLCIVALQLLAPASADAMQRIVGKPGTACPGAQYTSIGAAVSAAAPRDEILVCPALYDEQVVITKPLTLRGREVNGVGRVLVQPSVLSPDATMTEAVISVIGTRDVTIENLAIDASKNAVSSCSPGLAGIHFHNASGTVRDSAIGGAQLTNPTGCAKGLPFGNGWGIKIDANEAASFHVRIVHNSIHDYTANGVLARDSGVKVEIKANDIVGVGPSGGVFQFGVFLANGAAGTISDNLITEGNCGALAIDKCIALRSEGVTLRNIGPGTIVDGNIISKAQSGIFINGATKLRVTNNRISNIDAMSGMDIQGSASGAFTDSLIAENVISHVGPIDSSASNNEEGCGINEYSGTGVAGNKIVENIVNDAYCGVAYVSADEVDENVFRNTLYNTLNSDSYPDTFPPATEP